VVKSSASKPAWTPTFDEAIREISALLDNPFFPPRRRMELTIQLKGLRQLGICYIKTGIKHSKTGEMFWKDWLTFIGGIHSDITARVDSALAALDRTLVQLMSAIKLIPENQNKGRIQAMVTSLDADVRGLPSGVSDAEIKGIINRYKAFQARLSKDPNAQSPATVNVTRAISEILLHLTGLASISGMAVRVERLFEASSEFFRTIISDGALRDQPAPAPRQVSLPPPKRPAPWRPQPRAAPVPRQTNPHVPPKPELDELLGTFSDAEESDPDEEPLIQQLDQLAARRDGGERELQQKYESQPTDDPLAALRARKRELEAESISLNAMIHNLIGQIENESIASAYRENASLRAERVELTKQLLALRECCLRQNSVSQKAALYAQTGDCSSSSVVEDYQQALADNSKMTKKRDQLASELRELERKRERLLFEKYFAQLPKVDVINDLLRLKEEYKSKKEECLRQQQQRHRDEFLILKRTTQNQIAKLHTQAIADTRDSLAKKEQLTAQYNELKDSYNRAVQDGADEVVVDGETIDVEEALMTLESLTQQHAQCVRAIKDVNMREIEAETLVIQNEIQKLESGNCALVKWIDQLQQSTAEAQAELQSLTIRCELLDKKKADPDFDVNATFDEALQATLQGNERLNRLLHDVTTELTELDMELGDTNPGLTLEERIVSISNKMRNRINTDEQGD
jgi:hypothetical protein